jgi:hypothetical protein
MGFAFGGCSVSKGNPRITIRLPPGQRAMLKAEATARQCTVSDLLRRLAHEFLKKRDNV